METEAKKSLSRNDIFEIFGRDYPELDKLKELYALLDEQKSSKKDKYTIRETKNKICKHTKKIKKNSIKNREKFKEFETKYEFLLPEEIWYIRGLSGEYFRLFKSTKYVSNYEVCMAYINWEKSSKKHHYQTAHIRESLLLHGRCPKEIKGIIFNDLTHDGIFVSEKEVSFIRLYSFTCIFSLSGNFEKESMRYCTPSYVFASPKREIFFPYEFFENEIYKKIKLKNNIKFATFKCESGKSITLSVDPKTSRIASPTIVE